MLKKSAPGTIVLLLMSLTGGAQDKPADDIEYRLIEFGDGAAVFEDGPTPRLRVRANFYQGKDGNPWHSSPGQVSIEHGLPRWNPAYLEAFQNFGEGQRWRLGSNYWTNLSTAFPLAQRDQRLPTGYYYLVLEKGSGESFQLAFLDPASVRKLAIDPWHVDRQQSGPAVWKLDLKRGADQEPLESLEIRLKLQDEDPKKFRIDIRFGPILLQTDWVSVEF